MTWRTWASGLVIVAVVAAPASSFAQGWAPGSQGTAQTAGIAAGPHAPGPHAAAPSYTARSNAAIPYATAPGTATPGTATPGTAAPGTAAPGTATPGTTAHGSAAANGGTATQGARPPRRPTGTGTDRGTLPGAAPGAGARTWIVVGTVFSVNGTRSITLREPGHATATLPLASGVAVRYAGKTSSVAALASGQRVAVAINHHAEVSAIRVVGAPAAAAGAATAPAVSAIGISPDPVAYAGSLAAGRSVSLIVYATAAGGSPASGATIYLTFARVPGGGSATVGSTTLGVDPAAFTTDADGIVTVTFTMPAVLPSGGADALTAANAAGTASAVATDSYSFAPAAAGAAAPFGQTVSGMLAAVSAADIALTSGTMTSVYPLGPAVAVTVGRQSGTLGALAVGQSVTLTLDAQGQVTAVAVTAPAPLTAATPPAPTPPATPPVPSRPVGPASIASPTLPPTPS